jgi:hypothetical protein
MYEIGHSVPTDKVTPTLQDSASGRRKWVLKTRFVQYTWLPFKPDTNRQKKTQYKKRHHCRNTEGKKMHSSLEDDNRNLNSF